MRVVFTDGVCICRLNEVPPFIGFPFQSMGLLFNYEAFFTRIKFHTYTPSVDGGGKGHCEKEFHALRACFRTALKKKLEALKAKHEDFVSDASTEADSLRAHYCSASRKSCSASSMESRTADHSALCQFCLVVS